MTSWRAFILVHVLMINVTVMVYAQQKAVTEGKVEIIQDSRLPLLIDKHIQINNTIQGVMDGYRIQIYFDSGAESKKRALDVRNDFTTRFPGIPAYVSFHEPFFKVRVGDFRIKLEADGLLLKLLMFYPHAYVVRDRINYPELVIINHQE